MKKFRHLLIPLAAVLALFLSAAVPEAASTAVLKQTQTTSNSTVIQWSNLYKETKTSKVQSYRVTWGTDKNNQYGNSGDLVPKTRKYQITGLNSNSHYFVQVYYTVKTEPAASPTTPAGTTPTPTPTPTPAKITTYVRGLTIYTAPGKVTNIGDYDYLYTQTGFEIYWSKPDGNNQNYYQYEIYSRNGKRLMSGTLNNRTLYLASFAYNQNITRFRVRALFRHPSTGAVLTGEWSNYKALIPQPILKLDTSKYSISEKGKLKIAWNRIKGATKYYVYASTKPTKDFKKIGTVKQKSKKTIGISLKKDFKLNKVYYIKVVTVVKGSGKSDGRYFLPIWRYNY